MQISPEVMHEQVGSIYEQQKKIGYASNLQVNVVFDPGSPSAPPAKPPGAATGAGGTP
jgi:hypothetical protein